METNETDKLLKQFFGERKQEIADNGFSQRVMRKLPELPATGKDHSWIVWIFAALGMAISLYLGLSSGILEQVSALVGKIPLLYLLAGIAAFPLVGTAGYFLAQEKGYRVI